MTAIYIIIAILIPLAILLCSPFKIYVSCINNKFSIKIRYLFLKKILLANKKNNLSENKNVKEKNKTKRNDKKKLWKSNKSDKHSSQTKNHGKFMPKNKEERLEFIINVFKSSKKALKHFTKRITIYDICADIDISDSDACNCAIKYGKINIIAYNILSFMSCFFRLKKKHININCVYNQPESVYNFSFIVKFTPSSGILSVIAFIFTFLANNKKVRNQSEETETVSA